MRTPGAKFFWLAFFLAWTVAASAKTLLFYEADFAAADTAQPTLSILQQAFPEAVVVNAAQLNAALDAQTELLILPYGSAFPEACWPAMYRYLLAGGNLLNLGGKPFTRPTAHENNHWQARAPSDAFTRPLLISDAQPTPGSESLQQRTNTDAIGEPLPLFSWTRAFSLILRLSDEAISNEDGASGTLDAQLTTLVYGMHGMHRLSAPIVQIDHWRNRFAGGRWILLNATLDQNFAQQQTTVPLLSTLAARARHGAEEFRITPLYPLFIAGEPWQLQIIARSRPSSTASSRSVQITVENDDRVEAKTSIVLTGATASITIAPIASPGMRIVTAQLRENGSTVAIAHTGFWIRDCAYLRSGPSLSVNRDFFEIDHHVLPVVGTTYMASDAQRLFFRMPNVALWDRDMEQIAHAGLNMLRSGWWSDWNQLTDATGQASEQTLRTLEAFLMTARKHRLPVQWNFFAFTPNAFGGGNPYLAPEALRRESSFVASVVAPFRDVPFLAWDLINEPSFDNPSRLWTTRPNGDAIEKSQWNQWLLARYGSREEISSLWQSIPETGDLPVPEEHDFQWRTANDGAHPLAFYDFVLFAQEKFLDWASTMRSTIRATGSTQLITVGQDEGGLRLSPAPFFFKPSVDFVSLHTWWLNDALLWSTLSARQSGMPLLTQETGIQNEFDADGRTRRTPEADAQLLERKLAVALGAGAGAIEWLWNTNALMRSQQEATIGALRADGTEKPEVRVLAGFARFATTAPKRFREPVQEDVAILASQAEQYSSLTELAATATMRAVRVMQVQCHLPVRIVAENHIDEIRTAKLVVVPSALMLSSFSWDALLTYVEGGGHLLVTGPVERNEHWQRRARLSALIPEASVGALTLHGATLTLDAQSIPLEFPSFVQQSAEALALPGEKTYLEIHHGAGTIFVAAYPVELANAAEPTRALYAHALAHLGLTPPFTGTISSDSVLVRPVAFHDALLYLFVSETDEATKIDLRDMATGARLHFTLASGRARLLLLDKKSGGIVAQYDPPDLSMLP